MLTLVQRMNYFDYFFVLFYFIFFGISRYHKRKLHVKTSTFNLNNRTNFHLLYFIVLYITGDVFTVEVALDLRGLNSMISQRKRVSQIS